MRAISTASALIALSLILVLFSASAHTEAADDATCRKAVGAKKPCATVRPNYPARSACIKAAMERCKANGPGAI